MNAEEIVEKLEWAKRLYDEAGALLLSVAEDQKAAMERDEATLGIGAHLGAVSEGHQRANAALLLATVKAREAAEGESALAGSVNRRERREKKARRTRDLER